MKFGDSFFVDIWFCWKVHLLSYINCSHPIVILGLTVCISDIEIAHEVDKKRNPLCRFL